MCLLRSRTARAASGDAVQSKRVSGCCVVGALPLHLHKVVWGSSCSPSACSNRHGSCKLCVAMGLFDLSAAVSQDGKQAAACSLLVLVLVFLCSCLWLVEGEKVHGLPSPPQFPLLLWLVVCRSLVAACCMVVGLRSCA